MSEPAESRGRSTAVAVALLTSRVMGLVRSRVVAHYAGSSQAADIVAGVLRGGNQLQNLLGEQALSASFIPIYSRFLAEERGEDGRRFAGAVLSLLTVVTSVAVALGVLAAPLVVRISFPGWEDPEVTELAVRGVRYVFPMAGILVLSAWCLAVLNSHRRFFLPYAAPVLWNVTIIGVLIASMRGGGPDASEDPAPLVLAVCLGALLGGVAQLLVQLPTTLEVLGGLRLGLSRRVEGLAEAVRRFVPAMLGRGSGVLSGWMDYFLASFLAYGAVVSLERAQRLYLLPIALFATAVAVVELPELSRLSDGERRSRVGERLRAAFRSSSFLIVPTTLGFLLFGVPLVGAVYQSGRFAAADAVLVAAVLGCYSLGMLAAAASRLLQNGFFVWGDTRSPAIIGFARVGVAASVGAAAMVPLDRWTVADLAPELAGGSTLFLGAAGLALGSAVGSWVETVWLTTRLQRRYGVAGLPWGFAARCAVRATLCALPVLALTWLSPALHPILAAAVAVSLFAALYLASAWWGGLPEAEAWVGRFLRRRR